MYYLITYPETVASVLSTGALPASIPSRLKVSHLICKKSITDCLAGNDITLHQVFILQLTIPAKRDEQDFVYEDPEEEPNGIVIPHIVKSEWIQKIIIYSEQGYKLLSQLLKNVLCKASISINPDLYVQILFSKNQFSKFKFGCNR